MGLESDEIHFYSLPLEDEAKKMWTYYAPIYATALEKNISDKFFGNMKVRSNSNQNMILSSLGRQGSGKSYVIIKINEIRLMLVGGRLDIKNCEFTLTNLLKAIEQRGPDDKDFINDEKFISFGYGAELERAMLRNIENTTRKFGLNFYFLCPEDVKHQHIWKLETWEWGGYEEEFNPNISMEKQWVFTKSIVFSDKNIPVGYLITGTPQDKKFLQAYEKKKEKFLDFVTKFTGSQRIKMLDERCYELLTNREKIFSSPISNMKDNFLQRWCKCKSIDLKIMTLQSALANTPFGMVSTKELSQMARKVEYVIAFEKSIASEAVKYGYSKSKLPALFDKIDKQRYIKKHTQKIK